MNSDNDFLVAFREANMNLTHAAKVLGVSRYIVSSTLSRLGIRIAKPQKNKRVVIDKSVLEDLYHGKRMSTAEIARQFDVSAEGVRELMIRYAIPRRIVGSCPGDKNPSWKGGRVVDKSGYILVHCPDHPNSNLNGYIREHRLVMSEKIGRPLLRDEVVHHIDGDKQNNSVENLEVYDKNGSHLRHELTGKVPNWTPEGQARIYHHLRNMPKESLKAAWTDERREKARQRTLARHARGEFGPGTWTEESHRRLSDFAKGRNLPRLPDGTYAPQIRQDQAHLTE